VIRIRRLHPASALFLAMVAGSLAASATPLAAQVLRAPQVPEIRPAAQADPLSALA
jgi:hypothetical protein